MAIASECPKCHVLATDKSSAALKVAQNNAANLGLHQVEFLLSDWCVGLGERKANFIISNPPYIANTDPHLSQLQYEPQDALVAGNDGLSDIRQLIADAPAHLLPQGSLLLEHAYDQAEKVQALFKQHTYKAVKTYKDLAGLDRVTVGYL